MKKIFNLIPLLLCVTFFVTALAYCSGSVDADDEWTPTGEEITLLESGVSSDFVIVFARDDDFAHSAASKFKNKLLEENIRTAASAMSDNVSAEDKEIIFGAASRDVAQRAQELLDEKSKETKNDLHCLFYYYDG